MCLNSFLKEFTVYKKVERNDLYKYKKVQNYLTNVLYMCLSVSNTVAGGTSIFF